MKKDRLLDAAARAVNQSLKIRKAENFLLVTDKSKMEIAEAFAYWAKEAGAEMTVFWEDRNFIGSSWRLTGGQDL